MNNCVQILNTSVDEENFDGHPVSTREITIDERWLVRAAPGKPHYDLLGLRPVQVELRLGHSEDNRMSMNKSADVRIGEKTVRHFEDR